MLTSVLGTVFYISHMPCISNLSLCETHAPFFSKLSTLVMSLNSGIFCIWVRYSINVWYTHKYYNLNFLFFIIHNHGEHGKVCHHPFTGRVFCPAKCSVAWLIGASVSWRLNWNKICQFWLFSYLYLYLYLQLMWGIYFLTLYIWTASVLCFNYRSTYNCSDCYIITNLT